MAREYRRRTPIPMVEVFANLLDNALRQRLQAAAGSGCPLPARSSMLTVARPRPEPGPRASATFKVLLPLEA